MERFSTRNKLQVWLTIVLVISTCSCKSAPTSEQCGTNEVEREPRVQTVELQGLRRFFFGPKSRMYGHSRNEDDYLGDRGYVFFEEGTVKPVGWAGKFGSCAAEPPLPPGYRHLKSFRCSFAKDAAVEIHGYAMPREVASISHADNLSHRRVSFLKHRLDSVALPSVIKSTDTHTDILPTDSVKPRNDGVPIDAASEHNHALGLMFRITDCEPESEDTSACKRTRAASKDVNHPSRSENSGPLTRLHRKNEFQPDWKPLNTDSLGDRLVLFSHRAFRFGYYEKTVVIDDDKALCREVNESEHDYNLVWFKPNSATPIGYTGDAGCLAEPSLGNPPNSGYPDYLSCNFNPEFRVILDGYAWDSERKAPSQQRNLSRRRIDAVRRRLPHAALPKRIQAVHPHGASLTTAPVDDGRPVPGVLVRIIDDNFSPNPSRIVGTETDPDGPRFRYRQSVSDPWTDSQMKSFREFMRENPERHKQALLTDWFMSIEYRRTNGTVASRSTNHFRPPATKIALLDWATALVENECDISETGMPGKFLSD